MLLILHPDPSLSEPDFAFKLHKVYFTHTITQCAMDEWSLYPDKYASHEGSCDRISADSFHFFKVFLIITLINYLRKCSRNLRH